MAGNRDKLNDKLMREIAARYVERYGAALRRELAGGEPGAAEDEPRSDDGWTEIARREPDGRRVKRPQTVAIAAAEPRGLTVGEELDERILRGAARLRAKRTARCFGATATLLAAGIALAVLTQQNLGFIGRGVSDVFNGIIGVSGVMSGGQAANMTGDTQASVTTRPQTAPADDGDATEAATVAPALSTAATTTAAAGTVPPGETVAATTADTPTGAGGGQTVAAAARPEIIPLGFTPPSGFTAAGLDQDIDRTIYFYADARSDNVVISLRYGDLGAEIPEGYERIVLNGALDAYAAYNADYSALTFERAGVVYELTCRYDLNTLLGFCNGLTV